VNDALKAGDAAFKAKDYSTAIAKFDEGINADPEFEGSAPVLLNYKGVALKTRGFEAYERSVKGDPANKAAELEKAKADFLASMDAYEKGLKVLAAAKAATPADQTAYDKSKFNILNNYVESYRLIVKTKADVSKAKDAPPVYEQYFAAETDPARKLAARLTLADLLREAGESEPAIVAYRAVLESAPDNADALAGIGLSLFNVGVSEDNKAKMQEGLNYMTKFADTAPDTHPLKASVRDAVDYLKTEQKLAPQKVAAPRKKT
jgi:tetratricopeptide (TPR) repeat protein